MSNERHNKSTENDFKSALSDLISNNNNDENQFDPKSAIQEFENVCKDKFVEVSTKICDYIRKDFLLMAKNGTYKTINGKKVFSLELPLSIVKGYGPSGLTIAVNDTLARKLKNITYKCLTDEFVYGKEDGFMPSGYKVALFRFLPNVVCASQRVSPFKSNLDVRLEYPRYSQMFLNCIRELAAVDGIKVFLKLSFIADVPRGFCYSPERKIIDLEFDECDKLNVDDMKPTDIRRLMNMWNNRDKTRATDEGLCICARVEL